MIDGCFLSLSGKLAAGGGLVHTNSRTCFQEAGDGQRSETTTDQSIGVWEQDLGKIHACELSSLIYLPLPPLAADAIKSEEQKEGKK